MDVHLVLDARLCSEFLIAVEEPFNRGLNALAFVLLCARGRQANRIFGRKSALLNDRPV